MIDLLITDLGVFSRPDRHSGFQLIELAPDVSADEIATKTSAKYTVAL